MFKRRQRGSGKRRNPVQRLRLECEALEARALLSTASSGLVPRIINGTATSSFPSVGLVGDASEGDYGSGTLIGSRYVLTAGHCAEGVANTAGRFTLGGTTYATSHVYLYPGYNNNRIGEDGANDIAIFELDHAVSGVTPSAIYRSAPQVGQVLTLVGFGEGGTGASGGNGDFGIKRIGTTPIDGVQPHLVTWNFDNEKESNTAPGDSGGPAYIQSGGVYYVAGVTSGGTRDNAGLGDFSFDTRVDAYAAWIDSIVNNAPPPPPPPNKDDHGDTTATATLVTLGATGQGKITGVIGTATDKDFFRFVTSKSGQMAIDLKATASSLDTILAVYDAKGRLIAQNDDWGRGTDSHVKITVSAGQTYYARATGYGGSMGGYEVDWGAITRGTRTPATRSLRDVVEALVTSLGETNRHRH